MVQKTSKLPFTRLHELVQGAGLSLLGVTSALPLAEEAERLKTWQAEGRAGEMGFMLRDPGLLSNPQKLLPEAHTILIVAVRYDTSPRPKLRPNYGRVARYAWGRDYHEVLPHRLRAFVEILTREFGEVPFRIFSDAVPLMERGIGQRAGLGFVGKNTMLIRPKVGSMFFLAEVLLGLEVEGIPKVEVEENCGTCTQCAASCPTGALDQSYSLDARRCISYLSIEKRGALGIWERKALGEWAFGCDICQECCPFNHAILKRGDNPELVELSRKNGVGPEISIPEVLALRTNSAFERRFAGTALLRTRRAGLARNCAVVAANTGAVESIDALKDALANDASAVVRQHCGWAMSVLVRKFAARSEQWLREGLESRRRDPDEEVRNEIDSLLEQAI